MRYRKGFIRPKWQQFGASGPPRHRHAGDLHPDASQLVVAGHEQRFPVAAAPGDVGGVASLAQRNGADMLTFWVKDSHPSWPGTVNVAIEVALHAVGLADALVLQVADDA